MIQSTRRDHLVALAIVLGFSLIAVARIVMTSMPTDLGAYLMGVDLFVSGKNPYTMYKASALYDGFPYVYHPGTLWFTAPLHFLPTWLVLLGEALGRGALTVWVVRFMVDRLEVPVKWHLIALGLCLYFPFLADLHNANLALVMTALWLKSSQLSLWPEQFPTSQTKRILWGLGIGLVISLKPTWMLPCAWVALVGRQWKFMGALIVGAALPVGVGLIATPHWFADWLNLLELTRAHWHKWTLSNYGLWVNALGLAAWGGIGLWAMLKVKDVKKLWLWSCTSILVWPHVSIYSYVFVMPFVFFMGYWLFQMKNKVLRILGLAWLLLPPSMLWQSVFADMIPNYSDVHDRVLAAWLLGCVMVFVGRFFVRRVEAVGFD